MQNEIAFSDLCQFMVSLNENKVYKGGKVEVTCAFFYAGKVTHCIDELYSSRNFHRELFVFLC